MSRHFAATLALVAILGLVDAAPAAAHSFNPALLELHEHPSGQVDVLWKKNASSTSTSPETLVPLLPERCRRAPTRDADSPSSSAVKRWTVDCGAGGLAGQRIAVDGLATVGDEVLLRIVLADGRSLSAVLRSGAASFAVPAIGLGSRVGRGYLGLGIRHILSGLDHLLFVLGLILLVGPRWKLLKTITAFTCAHSVTLSLAALGVARLPQAPLEACIALSIVLLAVELTRPQEASTTWTRRRPWAMAFTFGLLHGFGFAGALAEVGLPAGQVPMALLAFNAGVEVGQLLFVAAVLPLVAAARAWLKQLPLWLIRAPAYGIGTMASYWCLERVAAFWP